MSKRKLNIEDKKYNYYIKECLSDSETSDINIYSNIISNKSLFHVTNQNHSSHISIKPQSLQKILLNGELEPYDQILFCYYKDMIPQLFNNNEKQKKENHHKNRLRSTKKEKEKKKENGDIILNVVNPNNFEENDEKRNMNVNNNNFYLNNFNEKNDDIKYGPDFELLDNVTNENIKPKEEYLITLYKNKININNENLKCFYLSLLVCGLIYIIYFLDVIMDKNKTINCLYNISSFPMATLLIITGIYGYYLINKKIYDDKLCIILTYLCFISPFISFIFSRISSQENVRKNIIMSIFINIVIIFFAGICIYILNKLAKKNYKNGLLFERVNII